MKKILLFLLTFLSLNISLANETNYFACAITTTWDGTTWDNGTPDLTTNAVFNADYTIASAFTACSVTVDNNAIVTVNSNITITIENEINVISGAYFVFENNASLLQNNSNAVNSGNITYKRDANPMIFADYTYWGSPVNGEVLNVFSPDTRADRYHTFNANSAVNNWVNASPSSTMIPGVGYAIRAPETYTTTPQVYNGEFNGIPNNGDIPVNVEGFNPTILNYNFISNPYPSAIDVVQLIDNTNLGTLYFWTHNTTLSGNDFTTDDYAIRTRTTGTAAISGGAAPSQYIGAGQGFFASAGTTTTINFTNAMRVSGNNTQFYKNAQNNPLNYYIHLNLTNTLGAFKQIAVGYQDDATDDYDFGTDALASTAGVIQFYSLIPSLAYRFGIQAKAYPWNIDDTIPLGINTTQTGTFDIAIDHNDVFFDDKDIFLEDTLNGIFHDLKASTFTFTTAIGTFNDRFILHYKNPSLNTSTFNLENQLNVTNSASEIIVSSSKETITSVAVFDLLGRVIFSTKNNNSNEIRVPKNTSSQPIIIKATLHNGNVVSKKYIF